MDKDIVNGKLHDQVKENMEVVMRDTEELLRTADRQTASGFHAARAQLEAAVDTARARLNVIEKRLTSSTRQAVDSTDRFVHDKPWQAIGIGAAVGMVIGLLAGRRR